MLEHFEVVELEQKWKQYKEGSKKFPLVFKFDKVVFLLLTSVAVGAICWLFFRTNNSTDLSNLEKNITSTTIIKKEEIAKVSDNLEVLGNNNIDNNEEIAPVVNLPNRGGLKFNEIGVDVSVDSGGFSINNSYDSTTSGIVDDRQSFTAIPKDEIIDFGKPPTSPKVASNIENKTPARSSSDNRGKIKIQTSNLKTDKSSLESKFYSTGNIMYSLSISENAYSKKNYDEAIKWALISNEVDKNSAQSWILFAKANYKKGNKQDALIALESFNAKRQNPEVQAVINQIKAGTL
ncbi:tetratricopeptide repeat protein [Campylobacter corcagiensis]|uniref:Transformation system protein n=1 Tax=Campylobacter corcagiensis TaxID=1448857 RepID=A0A7M1LF78_9BACT|nr:hypothetical protein [Campylobacter corcagiensis]QKF64608.1 hypothetical protein CCORG_0751 [Campylobacter corcagiensis]QOQ87219.1 hypothetical protein IMC76_08420 [Campylobacter corcagiensis]